LEFEVAYERFIQSHCEQRKGERKRRLLEGLGHAEKMFLAKVWWPTFHQFDHLHPEYEIHDYKDGYRYLDFAYLQPNFQMAIEIDGFGPHWRNITKWQFSDLCQRQNHLIIDGWNVIRLSYDELMERPRICEQTIQQLMGRWLGSAASASQLTALDREIIRLAIRTPMPITPRDVCKWLHVGPDYAQKLLRTLAQQQWLEPASGQLRIRSYQLHPARRNIKL
jgi:uncharacterized protein YneF (UPF0154 family)